MAAARDPGRRTAGAARSPSLIARAADLTWLSSCARCSAGARTSGDGTVSTATMRLPCITWAEAAQTPLWISSSLVAKPCCPAMRIFFSSRAAASGSRSASGARYSLRTLRRQAGQQQPGAGAALERERLAGLERDAQLLRGLHPVHAHRRPADQPDQDDGLAGLLGQVVHDRIGHVDDALGGLRRPGQADEPGGEPVAAALVAGQQPGLAQQRDVAVDAGQRDAGAFGELAGGERVVVGGEREHQGEDAACALTPVRGVRLRRHLDRGSPGHVTLLG